MSGLRSRLYSGELDPDKKEQVLTELKYFNSIAPRSLMERLHIDKGKMSEFAGEHLIGLIIGIIVLLPLLFLLLAVGIQFAVVGVLIFAIFRNRFSSPEYRGYNFGQRIVIPLMGLFDDKLNPGFHFNSSDLADGELSYDQALVESHMVVPMNRRHKEIIYSDCAYDWDNTSNTDAFEFLGYKLYYEWEDSDGDKHEEVYFDGTILKFRTSFTIDGTVNIMSTTTKKNIIGIEKEKNRFKKIKDKDITVIDTENSEFAENFDTIATYETEAYRYLTPTMIETLLGLRKNHDFCICIKGNVMSVAINEGCYKEAERQAFSATKPSSRSLDSEGELDSMIDKYRDALISIFELKDMLDPGGKRS